LRQYAEAHGLEPKRLDASAKEWLVRYDWPGNVRELGHLLERVTLLSADDVIASGTLSSLCLAPAGGGREHLPAPPPAPTPAGAPAESVDQTAQLRQALERAGGNVVKAAKLLGIGRNALRYRMRRLGIDRSALDAEPTPPPAPAETAESPPPAPPSWEQ